MKRKQRLVKQLKLICMISLFFILSACASTQVQSVRPYSEAKLPKPQVILVYDFSVPKEDIQLNQAAGAKLVRYAKKEPQSEQKEKLGLAVANSLSNQLVAELRQLGLPAVHATGKQLASANALLIVGQFENIDEGNRLRRIMVGFGAGRSEVKSHVQIYYFPNQLVAAFDTSAKSASKPGIIPIASAMNGVSEALQQTSVEQDATRTAKEIVKQLKPFLLKEGWVN